MKKKVYVYSKLQINTVGTIRDLLITVCLFNGCDKYNYS